MLSGWQTVEEVDDVVEPTLVADGWAAQAVSMCDRYFRLDISRTYFSDDGTFSGIAGVDFITDVRKMPNGLLGTDSDWLSMADLQVMLPDGVGHAEPMAACEEGPLLPVVEDEPWMSDPYMWEYLRADGDTTCGRVYALEKDRKAPGSASASSEAFSCSSEDSDLDDVAAMEELYDKRALLEGDHGLPTGEFTWELRGGKWTLRHKGSAYDCYRAKARTAEARRFCALYGFNMSASYKLSQYDEDVCVVLVKAWVARMEHWYSVWVSAGRDGTYRFRRSNENGWVESEDVAATYASGDARVRERVQQIRSLAPRHMDP